MRFERFSSSSVTEALQIIKVLADTIVMRQQQAFPQKQVSTSSPTPHPSVTKQVTEESIEPDPKITEMIEEQSEPKLTPISGTVGSSDESMEIEDTGTEVQLATGQEIIVALKNHAYKFDNLEITGNKAKMNSAISFFNEAVWKWTEEKIILTAKATVEQQAKIEIIVSHSVTSSKSSFNWFNPLENLSISIIPPELQKEFEQSYDIIRAIQGMNHSKLLDKIKYTVDNGQGTLVIEAEKTLNNIEKCFELIEAGSWKWLSKFVIA